MFLKKAISSTFIQILINICHLIFGLSLAYFFGAQKEMDAYVAASNFIIALNALFTTSQNSTFIPFISKYKNHSEQKEIISSIINTNLIFFSLFAIVVTVFSNEIVFILAPGLQNEQLVLASKILKVLSIYIVLTTWCALGSALLDYKFKFEKRFFLNLTQSLLCVLFFFFFVKRLHIYSPAIAHVLSFFIIAIIYLLFFFRSGYTIKTSIKLINNYVKEYYILLFPIVVSQFFVWLIRFSDVFVASFLPSGSISCLSYCQRINLYISVASTVICTIYFPVLSKITGENEKKQYLTTFYNGLQALATVSFSVGFFIFLFSYQVIELLFQRGAFSHNDTQIVSHLLRYYILVIICAPFGTYLANTYFSYRNTKLAMSFSIISSILNIILNIIFGYFFGLVGLAAASSLAFLCGNILQLSNIKRVNSDYKIYKAIKNLLKPFIASVLCFITFSYILNFNIAITIKKIIIMRIINLSIYFLAFFITYIIVCYFLKVEAVMNTLAKIKTRIIRVF